MKKLFVIFYFLTLVGCLGFGPQPVVAATDNCGKINQDAQNYGAELPNFPRYCSSGEVVRKVMNIAFALVGSVAIIFAMLGGYRYMAARGNEEQAAQGRKTLVYALVGLAVVILAVTIVNLVINAVVYDKIF